MSLVDAAGLPITDIGGGGGAIVQDAETAVTVPAAGFTTLATIANAGDQLLVFQFDVATQALDQFRIRAKAHASAQYLTYGDPANSWTDPSAANSNIAAGSRILETSGDLNTVAAAGNGSFAMDISGLVEVLVEASAAVNNASVTPRWSLQ